MSDLACAAASIVRPVAYVDPESWHAMMEAAVWYIGKELNRIVSLHDLKDTGGVLAASVALCEEFAVLPSLWQWHRFEGVTPQKARKYAALAEQCCSDSIDLDGWDTEEEDDEDGTYNEICNAFDPPVLYEADGSDDGPEVL